MLLLLSLSWQPSFLLRQINEFVKRVRTLKIHLLIIGHIRKAMPAIFGKAKAQRKILDNLSQIFTEVSICLSILHHSFITRHPRSLVILSLYTAICGMFHQLCHVTS